MKQIKIALGAIDCHFAENYRIARDNFYAGRPLFEGQLPATHIPDPRGDWLVLNVPDDDLGTAAP